MYHIDTKRDKPDINRLKRNVEEMMHKGIKIKEIGELQYKFNSTMEAVKTEICDKYGIANANSNKQIVEYLQRLSSSIPIGEKDEIIEVCYADDKWSCDKAVLNKLSMLGYEFADDLLFYRAVKKSAETVNSLADAMDEKGLVHPEVSLAKTNRVNYRNPALMNVQKELLRYVVEPRNKGDVLYSVDIKNQEPAILINALGEEALIKALHSKEGLYNNLYKFVFRPEAKMFVVYDTLMEDRIYSTEELRAIRVVSPAKYMPVKAPCMSWYINDKRIEAIETICQGTSIGAEDELTYPDVIRVATVDREVYSVRVQWEKGGKTNGKDFEVVGHLPDVEIRMSPQERAEFKTAFLAITYGASSFGIEEECKIIDGKRVYDKITKLPKMKEYRERCGRAAKSGVQTMVTAFGTQVVADKYGGVNQLKRSLSSIPVQGTGADILDLLVNHMQEEIQKKFNSTEVFVYYTRHDELIIEVGKEVHERYGDEAIKEWIKDCMEHQINDWVPFMVEVDRIENKDIKELLVE